MNLDEFVQSILDGIANQSDAESFNRDNVFRSIAAEIKEYPRLVGSTGNNKQSFLSKTNFYKIINAFTFVHLMYGREDFPIFIRILGRDFLMQSSPRILRLMHQHEYPLAEMVHFLMKGTAHERDDYVFFTQRNIKDKLKFISIKYD